jgi:hypothetical protein
MSESRALVRVETTADDVMPVTGPRPESPFLTQLLASARRFKAYRRHRRGEPDVAAALYSDIDAQAPSGASFQRRL